MTEAEYSLGARPGQILDVVRRSLGFIDRRLMDHGARVAYIAGSIADSAGGLGLDRQKLLILCLLHDIGAYKTEEIDNMVAFETGDVTAHAVYGYVFLRNTTALGAYAEAIYYHHTNYEMLGGIDTPQKRAAALIFLADRIDILLATGASGDWEGLRRLSGSAFSPELVELFLQAERETGISWRILDGSYRRAVQRQSRAIDLSREAIEGYLHMLVYSIDFRSPFTVTHTANTAAISKALCGMLALNAQEREDVALGAFLHDVGKIAIPYAILENPGKLDAAQMEKMRTHVAASEEILRGIVPDTVCRIAVRHHEKLNGSGYPRGLTAASLSLPERIVAVSDILSALINRRSYKEPFPKEKSLAILKAMRDDGELCPTVCDTVLARYDEIIAAVNQADDPVIRLYETIKREYAQYHAALRALEKPRLPAAAGPHRAAYVCPDR